MGRGPSSASTAKFSAAGSTPSNNAMANPGNITSTSSTSSTLFDSSTSIPKMSVVPAAKGTLMTTIAIAVVVPLAILAFAGMVYMWCRYRRQRNNNYHAHEVGTHVANGYELGSGLVRKVKRGELSGNARGISPYVELPADGRG